MRIPNYFVDKKGNFYTPFRTDLVSGFLPTRLPEITAPALRWHGPKIDLEKQWYPATTFMRDFIDHEVVLRLFVTADKKEIIIRPLTQLYGTGMSIKEEPTITEQEQIATLGLIDIGSVHSHCNMKAFASGVDSKDEKDWPGGLHLTVGDLDEERYDLHARFCWDLVGQEVNGRVIRKAQRLVQNCAYRDWFKLPQHVEYFLDQEEELSQDIAHYLLVKAVLAEYPDWWKEKLVVRSEPILYKGNLSQDALFNEMFPGKPKGDASTNPGTHI